MNPKGPCTHIVYIGSILRPKYILHGYMDPLGKGVGSYTLTLPQSSVEFALVTARELCASQPCELSLSLRDVRRVFMNRPAFYRAGSTYR